MQPIRNRKIPKSLTKDGSRKSKTLTYFPYWPKLTQTGPNISKLTLFTLIHKITQNKTKNWTNCT